MISSLLSKDPRFQSWIAGEVTCPAGRTVEQWVVFFTLLERKKCSQAELVMACTGEKTNLETCKGRKRLKKQRTNLEMCKGRKRLKKQSTNDADGDDDSEDDIFSNNNPKGMPSQASNK